MSGESPELIGPPVELLPAAPLKGPSWFTPMLAAILFLLLALAKDGVVKEPNSGDFIARHSFKSASSVNAALKSLRNADLVDRTDSGYLVYDRLFALWLSRLP